MNGRLGEAIAGATLLSVVIGWVLLNKDTVSDSSPTTKQSSIAATPMSPPSKAAPAGRKRVGTAGIKAAASSVATQTRSLRYVGEPPDDGAAGPEIRKGSSITSLDIATPSAERSALISASQSKYSDDVFELPKLKQFKTYTRAMPGHGILDPQTVDYDRSNSDVG